jgi:alanyl-tRNA synthetase
MAKAPHLTADIREAFLSFFEGQAHKRIASASLVPENDPTLLFTNAGMVQFKDCFLGADKRDYSRATSSQKCVRAGGKHNDLENVGFTSRHHTFFEMLGNFSFGDYFKEEAIVYAWDFSTRVLQLDPKKMRVSVHVSDDEGAKLWEKISGFKESQGKIVRFDEDNFWQMGDTGPCGPCSELFYDQGSEVDGDRWLEYWNCVFMQYDRDASGKLNPLPKPSVDTGMGLERIASILQGQSAGQWYSNYDIDIMSDLVLAARDLVGVRSGQKIEIQKGLIKTPWEVSALRVLVDHLRSTSFLIADGVLPSNEGRGYVLRRILRRAVRYGKRLGVNEPFLSELLPVLVSQMKSAYPEIEQRAPVIKEILKEEEEKFFVTLDKGLHLLDEVFAKLGSAKTLPADVAFKLYDTFGFPEDLTALIARERGVAVDQTGFVQLMQQAQERSRSSWKGSGETSILGEVKEWKNRNVFPRFTAYESGSESHATEVKVLAVSEGEEGAWVAIDPCPFYGEGGGQVGDRGFLELSEKKIQRLRHSKTL